MSQERIDIRITERGARQVKGNLEGMGKAADRSGKSMQLLQRAIGALGLGLLSRKLITTADSFTNMQNQIRLVTDSTAQLNVVTRELLTIANSTRSDLDATASLYVKTARSADRLGLSQRQVLEFTESLNQAITLSGSGAQEASAGLLQLGQAIGSGVLRGEELNSVLENTSEVAQVIAKGMGVTIGQLRTLGAEGKISAQDIIRSFQEAEGELSQRFGKTVPTVSQAMQVLGNTVTFAIGELNNGTGVTRVLAEAILVLSDNMGTLMRAAGALATTIGFVLAARAIPAAIAGFHALTAAMAANPFGAIAVAITAATSALIFFSDEIKVTADGFITLRDIGVSVYRMLRNWGTTAAQDVGNTFADTFDNTAEGFGMNLSVGAKMYKELTDEGDNWAFMIAGFIDRSIGMFIGMGKAIANVWTELGRRMERFFRSLDDFIMSGFDPDVFRPQGIMIGRSFKEGIINGIVEGGEFRFFRDLTSDVFEGAEIAALERVAAARTKANETSAVMAGLDRVPDPISTTVESTTKEVEEDIKEVREVFIRELTLMESAADRIFGPQGLLVRGIGDATAQAIVFGERLDESMKQVAQSVLATVISALTQAASIKALTSLGITTNAQNVVAAAAGQAAGQAAQVAGNPAGGFYSGGYTGNLPTGDVAGVTHGQEFVMSAAATRRIGRSNLEKMNSGGSVGAKMEVTVINRDIPSADFEVRQMDDNRVEIIAKRVAHRETPLIMSQELSNPNSRSSKALTSNTSAKRIRQ